MDAIAQDHRAQALWQGVLGRLAQLIGERQAHPARTVVLLPYAQLMPVARRFWMQLHPDGFAPRFETTMNWARAGGFEPGETDLGFDTGRDLLTARAWLVRAGLAGQADALAARLLEAVRQVAPIAAAVPPGQRAGWAAKACAGAVQGLDAPALQVEAALARIAIEWAAASAYASDALLSAGTADSIDLLVVLQGLQAEPLQQALLEQLASKAVALPLAITGPLGQIALHAAAGAADEAERAAACVLRHVAAGRLPVALAAVDRVLTRRVAALLHEAGVPTRDEPGWKLSTTRSAAQLMASLKACAWDASSDQVLDWLKHVPLFAPGLVLALERRLRQAGVREWRGFRDTDCGESAGLRALLEQVNGWRDAMRGGRSIAEWLHALRELLQATGQWTRLQRDAAGGRVLELLRLAEGEPLLFENVPQAARKLSPHEFTAWAEEVLESGNFVPDHVPDAPVVILPFEQTLARPFAALVLPGCDEQRLPASPEPPGAWTPAQRRALGLPSREMLEQAQHDAWMQALQSPHCDLLWRSADDKGEPLLPSPLVQSLQLQGLAAEGVEPRELRSLSAQPVPRPQPTAAELPLAQLSASAYEDLRRCPYRFFALRQLGLKEADEVDTELDKRDFGTWLHAVLRAFHEALQKGDPPEGRLRLLDQQAESALAALRLEPGEFLPFLAGWPAVRDGYLRWLEQHEASGARFARAESEHEAALAAVKLVGRVDRIDTLPQGDTLVIDYKTESLQASKDRMKQPLEDTQLAFYAALLGGDSLRAAYLNVSERGDVVAVEHPHLLQARDLLREAIEDELGRIASGAALPALGDGRACEFCAARGLCRKDGWE